MADSAPWRHIEQRLGRDLWEYIHEHLQRCPTCSRRCEVMHQAYVRGEYPEVKGPIIVDSQEFLQALHIVHRIKIGV